MIHKQHREWGKIKTRITHKEQRLSTWKGQDNECNTLQKTQEPRGLKTHSNQVKTGNIQYVSDNGTWGFTTNDDVRKKEN